MLLRVGIVCLLRDRSQLEKFNNSITDKILGIIKLKMRVENNTWPDMLLISNL